MEHLILGPKDSRCTFQLTEVLHVAAKRVAKRSRLGLSEWIRVQMARAVETFEDRERERQEATSEQECPHGIKYVDCAACDFKADLAYDAARESSFGSVRGRD